jgi:polyferredoxin
MYISDLEQKNDADFEKTCGVPVSPKASFPESTQFGVVNEVIRWTESTVLVKHHLPSFFWIEFVLASITALLAVVTLLWHDWIEQVFGFDPDLHSGFFEWGLVIALCLATALFAALARREWCRYSRLSAPFGP